MMERGKYISPGQQIKWGPKNEELKLWLCKYISDLPAILIIVQMRKTN
jgi:hypothetical protein